MTTLTETLHAGAFLISEAEGQRSRDQITVAVSQALLAGQVLGRTAVAASVTSSAAADAANTGNGTFTLDVSTPVSAAAQNGIYRAVCALTATNGGTFEVFDPSGREIGRVAVGATFNNQIKFVIADGSTDFAVGDAFNITVGVEATDYQWAAFDTTSTVGLQHAAGILFADVTTGGSATLQAVAITRAAEVRASDLIWPGSSLTAAQQAAATVELAALGIILR